MQDIYKLLETITFWHWLIFSAIWIVSHAIGYLVFAKWVLCKQWKLYKNLKRPVIILTPISEDRAPIVGGEMKNEISLLKSSGLLNISSADTNYQAFDPTGRHCVVVLGYMPGMAGLEDMMTRMKNNHVPLVVYTYGKNTAVQGRDKELFDQYPYVLYANFPLTLLNHIFSTVASYPYDRK